MRSHFGQKRKFLFEITFKNSFLLIASKISTFRRKLNCLRSLLKHSSFPLSSKIIDRFKKSVFSHPYIRKYQHFPKRTFLRLLLKIVVFENFNILRKTTLFWDHFGKVVYCPYLRKEEHFGDKHVSFQIISSIISIYINIIYILLYIFLFYFNLFIIIEKSTFHSGSVRRPKIKDLILKYFVILK